MRPIPSVMLLVVGLLAAGTGPALSDPIRLAQRAVPLHADAPDQMAVGKLRYAGGLVLSADDAAFGGLSALGVSADGRRMIALSDSGHRLAANLTYHADGRLKALEDTDLSTLAGLDGRPLRAKPQADAEAMSPGVDGEIIVGFERNHRIWRYLPGVLVPDPLRPPAELAGMPRNSGIEALTLMNDGRLLAITEGLDGTVGDAVGWVSDPAGWSLLTYAKRDGFRPTGAATLPGGDVLVLERRYTLRDGVAVRVQRIDAGAVEPGARLVPRLVADLRPPLTVDNFEGIDIRRAADGRTWVYIVSDDNFNPLQRTLLMMFELME